MCYWEVERCLDRLSWGCPNWAVGRWHHGGGRGCVMVVVMVMGMVAVMVMVMVVVVYDS